ncbi:polymeric immunoglobulin receptor-like [Pimephales promelas]|nr:polymeric immunoglobulin receptor-like [Pimephales promelas]
MKIIWTFTLMMIPGVVSSMSVTGYSGGGVNITCEYDEKYKENTKYFCKGDWLSCIDRIKTDIKDKWVHNGRFSLYDDTRSAVFTVTIRNLTGEDSGTYQCAVDIPKDIDSSTEVKLKISTGQQTRTVRGYSGGNVIINYKYELIHTNHVIDVCKTSSDQCFTVIKTNRRAEWKHDRRFSAHDDTSAGLLRLFIRDLNENDSGEYKIIVKVSEDYSFFSEFDLDIKTDDCCVKSISLSASAGGSVNINCKYPQSHSGDVKFLCWRSGADLCAKETSVNESRRWRDEGKIQLYDDREQQLLTGRISHVTEEDSEYWCGVQTDQGHKIFITRVLIRVTVSETPPPPSSSPPPSSTSSASSFSAVKTSASTGVSTAAVLPKFDVTVYAPQTYSVAVMGLKVESCAKCTYGQPVPGQALVEVCRDPFPYSLLHNLIRQCLTQTAKMNATGCASITVDTSVFLNTKFEDQMQDTFLLSLNVTEEGTVTAAYSFVGEAGSYSADNLYALIMAPAVQILVHSVLPSENVVAASVPFGTEMYFQNQVSLQFSPATAVPVEGNVLTVSAQAGSLRGRSEHPDPGARKTSEC